MRAAITGGGGQLATELELALRHSGHEAFPFRHAEWDIRDRQQTEGILDAYSFDVVINTAAFHRVDDAEDQADVAFAINATAVRDLAWATARRHQRLLHISTDYVFDGESQRPYVESDLPRPLNVYGASKLAGEALALSSNEGTTVVRSSGLFGRVGSSGKGGNFVDTMLRLAASGKPLRVVDDQTLSPTYCPHLAAAIVSLAERSALGVFHVAGSGWTTFYDYAREIFALTGLSPAISPQTSAESGARARRPRFSPLISERLEPFGVGPLPSWKEGLKAYLASRRAEAPR